MPISEGVKPGRIRKPHGIQGEVQLIANPAFIKSIETGIPLFIDIDGQRVPFFIEELKPVSDDQVILKFEFVNRIEEARAICGYDVYSEHQSGVSDISNLHDLHAVKGYSAHDHLVGSLGMVLSFVDNDLNPMLIVDYQGRELMVPAAKEIITGINHKEKTIHFNLPEGLSSL